MTGFNNVLDLERDDMSSPDGKLNSAIWLPRPIASMSLLAALREAVLIRSTKRMPKWKFRVASDVVIQIQPRVEGRAEPLATFDCRAILRDGATGDLLTGKRPRDCWQIEFLLRDWEYADLAKPLRVPAALRPICRTKEAWNLKPYGVGYFSGKPMNDIFAFRDRLIDILPCAFVTLRPAMMLRPACLACGKRLTDPISMARWIGPECAGTASAIMPYTIILSPAA